MENSIFGVINHLTEQEKSYQEQQKKFDDYNLKQLSKIKKFLLNNKTLPTALYNLLEPNNTKSRVDIYNDISFAKEYSSPHYISQVKWPNGISFNLAQQYAINIANSMNDGVFSINGASGTGKNIITKEIISFNIYKKALLLSKLKNPQDIYIKNIDFEIDDVNYTIWELNKEFLGNDIIVLNKNKTSPVPKTGKLINLEDLTKYKNNKNWSDAKTDFLESLAKVQKKLDMLESFNKESEKSHEVEIELIKLLKTIDEKNDGLEPIQNQYTKSNEKIKRLNYIIVARKKILEFRLKNKPNVMLFALSFFKKISTINEWKNSILYIQNQMKNAESKLKKEEEQNKTLKNTINIFNKAICSLNKKADSYKEQLKDLVTSEENKPDHFFWSLPKKQLQKRSPWYCSELNKLREELFVHSINLFICFLLNTKKQFSNNYNCLTQLLLEDNFPKKHKNYVSSILANISFYSPYLETNLDFAKKLSCYLEPESINYLLVKNSDKIRPQEIISSAFLAKKIITLSDLKNNEDDCKAFSLQNLTNTKNIYGTLKDKKWISFPLMVNYKYQEPIFTLINQIVYNGFMINDVKLKRSEISSYISHSMWINTQSDIENSIIKEIKSLLSLLKEITVNSKVLPKLFIITQPNSLCLIKNKLKSHLNIWTNGFICEKEATKWVDKNVGVADNFISKKTEAIILILDNDSATIDDLNKNDSIFSSSDYLQNVLSMSQSMVFIIGDKKLWTKNTYFKKLDQALIGFYTF